MTIFERYQSAGVVPPPRHLQAKKPRPIRLDDTTGRAFALTDPPKGTVREIVRVLDVERSARYRPTAQQTQCNVYAHDVVHALAAYLPRVWWKEGEPGDGNEGHLHWAMVLAKDWASRHDGSVARALEDVDWIARYRVNCREIRANGCASAGVLVANGIGEEGRRMAREVWS